MSQCIVQPFGRLAGKLLRAISLGLSAVTLALGMAMIAEPAARADGPHKSTPPQPAASLTQSRTQTPTPAVQARPARTANVFNVAAQRLPADINGDAASDLLVRQPRWNAHAPVHGRVTVRCGLTMVDRCVIVGPDAGDLFGYAATFIDDLDGDGRADIAIAAPLAAATTDLPGRVYLHSSADGRMLAELAGEPHQTFGVGLALAADRDGDGRHELIVASFTPSTPREARLHADAASRGQFGPHGLASTWSLTSPATGDTLAAGRTLDLSPLAGIEPRAMDWHIVGTMPPGEAGHDASHERGILYGLPTDLDADGVVAMSDVMEMVEILALRSDPLIAAALDGPQSARRAAFRGDVNFDGSVNNGDLLEVLLRLGDELDHDGGNPRFEPSQCHTPPFGSGKICLSPEGPPSGGNPIEPAPDDPTTDPGDPGVPCPSCKDPNNPPGGGCPGDHDCDGIPDPEDCDSPIFAGNPDCCKDDDGDGFKNQDDCDMPECFPPTRPHNPCCGDDDCDGISNQNDCDSPQCSSPGGRATPNPCCGDDDDDGIPNNEDPRHSCYVRPNLDIRIDSNNDGSIDVEDELAEEDLPGQLLLATQHDHDLDGWPDFADGYNLVDRPQFTIDDHLSGVSFARMTVRFSGPCRDDPALTIAYSASDPLQARVLGGWSPSSGSLRLWRKNASSARDPRSVLDGGDYIPPGSHLASDIGTNGSDLTLWVESVRPSHSAGDQIVHIEADCGDCDGSDWVRFTSSHVALYGRYADAPAWRFMPAMVPTQLYDVSDPPEPEALPILTMPFIHKVVITDPRWKGGNFTIAGQALQMHDHGGHWESEHFWVDSPPFYVNPAGMPAFRRIVIPGDWAQWEYNPSGKAPKMKQIMATQDDILLQRMLDDVVELMEADTQHSWRSAYTPNDPGAYGKEVNKRLGIVMQGRRDWHTNVWFDMQTKTVVSIGQPPSGGTTGLMEMDVIKMKKGQALNVGDAFDWGKIDAVHEVKTSIQGTIDGAQKIKYAHICGNHMYRLQNPSKYFHQASQTYVPHERGAKLRRISKVLAGAGTAAGAAGTVLAVAFPADTEALVDDVIRKYDVLEDSWDHPMHGAPAGFEFGTSLGQFCTARSGNDLTGFTAYFTTMMVLYFQEQQ